ncbi:PDC sensor domain-containing protein, partial [Helicobacter ibis]
MYSFDNDNVNNLASLVKHITTNFDYDDLSSLESLKRNIGVILKSYRDAGNYLGVYIAHPTGEIVVNDAEADAANEDAVIYGKAQNYDARTRDWYIGATKSDKVYITAPYIDVTTGLSTFTYAKSIYDEGKFVGVLAIDVLVNDLQESFKHNPGRIFAFDKNAIVFVSNDETLLPKKEGEVNPDIKTISELRKKYKDYEPFNYIRSDGSERFVVCTSVSEYGICISESVDEVEEPVERIAYIQSVIVVFTSLASIILLYFIISRMLTPLQFIQQGLLSFFKYINYESKQAPKPIAI